MSHDTSPTWADIDRVQPNLQAFLATRLRDPHELDDALQETLLRAARHRATGTCPNNMASWIVRIAENVLAEQHRRRARRPVRQVELEFLDALEGREPAPGAEGESTLWRVGSEALAHDQLFDCVGGALRELDDDDQELLDRFYSGAGRCREAAHGLGLGPSAIKSRLHRARARLTELVEERLKRLTGGPLAAQVGASPAGCSMDGPSTRRRGARRSKRGCGRRAAKE